MTTSKGIKTIVALTAVAMGGLVCNIAAHEKPMKVYILAGQSNMQGTADIATFDYIGHDPATAPMLKEMRSADGKPHVCEKVWISHYTKDEDLAAASGKLTAGYGGAYVPGTLGTQIRREFTFGIYMQKMLDGPILITKTAWGGKDLYCDFYPPSAGTPAYTIKPKGGTDRKVGLYYRLMMAHVKKVLADPKRVCPAYDQKQGVEVAGFVWFQGWNDYCYTNWAR